MLTTRTGAAGTPIAAKAMAEYLTEQEPPNELGNTAASYYTAKTTAILRPDLTAAQAADLGLQINQRLTTQQIAHLFTGLTAVGEKIPGKTYGTFHERIDTRGIKHEVAPVAYVDMTFSAPKSLSIALVKAPTEFERELLFNAHWLAVQKTVDHIETQIGVIRSGAGGLGPTEQGKLTWVAFHHYAARPTVAIPFTENGIPATQLVSMKAAGDPQLHTHLVVLNYLKGESGRVGSINLSRLRGGTKEWGAIYQAFLGTELRKHGVEWELDKETGMGRLTSVPRTVCKHMSKASVKGEAAARAYAKGEGLDWDAMGPDEQKSLVKRAINRRRQPKTQAEKRVFGRDDLGDAARWNEQFDAIGYKHRSVLRPDAKQELLPEEERVEIARRASMPLLSDEFERRAVVEASMPRIIAAKGLIESGIAHASDVDKITTTYRIHGVEQDHETAPLVWGRVPETGRLGVTTGLHVSREQEFITLAQKAHADHSSVIPAWKLAREVYKSGLDFTDEHGKKQRAIIDTVANGGKLTVFIGVAGSGKTAILSPLVAAWRDEGKRVFGIGLANRHAKRLVETGMADKDTMSVYKLLTVFDQSQLNQDSVLVIDEISMVDTRQMLEILQLREQRGFQIVALGDDRQSQSVAAGSIIDLMRHAVGKEAVPEILSTLRQKRQRDRETSLMFRDGRAAEALARKLEDGKVIVVPGGREHAIAATVKLWEERREVLKQNADPPSKRGLQTIPLGISAATNEDARDIGAAVRARRKELGEIGPDLKTLKAGDQAGATYDLPIAIGDNVRLFRGTWARFDDGKKGPIGWNGHVVEVRAIQSDGLKLRATDGREGFVPWDDLKYGETDDRIRLTYGDAITVDARTGDTTREHILAPVSGSHKLNSNKGYVGLSRETEESWLVLSDGEERREIQARRSSGDPRPVTIDSVINNVARNLSHQPRKISATELIETAHDLRHGKSQSKKHLHEHKVHPDRVPKAPWVEPPQPREEAKQDGSVCEPAQVSEPSKDKGTQRPRKVTRMPVSEAEAAADFADALSRSGLRLGGPPVMDGRLHRVPVDGDRGKKKSGAYVGHIDGFPAGYIRNYKTGEERRWRAKDGLRNRSPEEEKREQQRVDAMRRDREREERKKHQAASARAQRMWDAARPTRDAQAYLQAKQIMAHGTRQNRLGELIVPMRDIDGRIWSLQTIGDDSKLYQKGGKRDGTHMLMGEVSPDKPLVIVEGFATGASVREATSLPVAVAFDSSGLKSVAKAYRERYPAMPIVFAADNDHHLPRRDTPLPNAGLEKAQAAASEVKGHVIAPHFDSSDKGTDWNDYNLAQGAEATREAIGAGLKENGIAVELRQMEPPIVTQADREAARAKASTPAASYTSQAASQQQNTNDQQPTL